MKYKDIIFDCSDTLLRLGSIDLMARLCGGDRQYGEELHYRIFTSPAWHDYDRGYIDFDTLETRVLPMLNEEEQAIAKTYLRQWMETYTVIDGIPELLQQLKNAGCRLYLLSDFPDCFETLWNRYPDIFSLFDGRVISYEVGHRKADRGLFTALLEKYQLRPEACFFADDAPINVQIAEELGIHSHLFTDVDTLRQALFA